MKKKLIVLGAGKSGFGAAVLGKKEGYEVFLSEKKSVNKNTQKLLFKEKISWESGQHTLDEMLDAQLVIKSPGIPSNIKLIQDLKRHGILIISEIEFASQYTDATLIGITGTNGKTTTALLTYEILKNAGFNVGLAGNIGNSFALQVANSDYEYYVLEISSFQLDDIQDFAPDISVITNITPDHLDRYNYSFDEYIKSKLKIIQNQKKSDFFLFNIDDQHLKSAVQKTKIDAQKISFGIDTSQSQTTFKNKNIKIKNQKSITMINSTQFKLSGRHNLLNAMAAATIGNLLDISKESIRESLTNFKGAPHRMEKVLTIQHVAYVNDSKATNINATYFALESINNQLIWIVGGVDKGNQYESLLP